MRKGRKGRIIISVFILFVIQVLLFLFVSNKVFFISGLVLINMCLMKQMFNLVKIVEISNTEKIREASTIAEKSIDYAMNEVPVGIISYDSQTKEAQWLNPYAEKIFNDGELLIDSKKIQSFLSSAKKRKDVFKSNGKVYQFDVNELQHTITFKDITEESNLHKEKFEMQTAIGIVSIDNYDDITDSMNEREISYLNSFLTTIISDWLEEYQVFYKRINAERYFFIAQLEDIKKMMDNKFQILDTLRNEAKSREFAVTLSMGIAYGGSTLNQTGNTAQTNLDTALVRGGDQVVVKEAKDDAKPIFFGGRTASVGKRTRVRSRAMSTALKGILSESADVYIMGHRFPDMDAIGSAFGVACLARFYGKRAWIVLNENEVIPDVERVMEHLKKYPELQQQIITPKEAIKRKTDSSLLVMVDYHKPSLSISQELYERFEKVVIIDHHRRGEEFPAKPLLAYIESSASSASELVTELIEYQSNAEKKLQKIEATLLLAGIVVDTKSFSVRTTARTFDVASYLRTCSADSSLVQYLLSSDLNSYLEMSGLISKSEYITTDIVVVAGEESKEYDSVVAAKTADTLMSMSGINASFVITKRTDKQIGISARSNGIINVQLIMENLGGGGHFTNAAVQLSGKTIAEVKHLLLEAIHQNTTEMYGKE
ncbi:DHH family phosphoesterase [Enterococcus rivorum]|uniref:Cyclic-di-AMP phosphodiesterase n=1 Tax=Enterococcus rivorum TaxID=762845 RepID=A0A1E5KUX4_9ENTE|nr:DHH family phosphoesterase [Enterococcus rivorum]MBP2099071.1 c-di-AMP phosphodiesterase-like protein [Enterococcus rivorum]OEH81672.1 phosphoesterase [Enterococcus rivorum]